MLLKTIGPAAIGVSIALATWGCAVEEEPGRDQVAAAAVNAADLLCNDSYCDCINDGRSHSDCRMYCEGGEYYYGYGSRPDCGGSCKPVTCKQRGATCGTIDDGCGGAQECGECRPPQTCGGGGIANQCGSGSCKPVTCKQRGATCGLIDDGCGSVRDCGSCDLPETCGGGGVANQCGSVGGSRNGGGSRNRGDLLCNDSYCDCINDGRPHSDCRMYCEGGEYYYGYGAKPNCG